MTTHPQPTRPPRDERIEIRCYGTEKSLLRQAATIEHRTLSNWLLFVALREARSIVEAHHRSESSAARSEQAGQAPSL